MIATLLLVAFVVLMLLGVPIGAALERVMDFEPEPISALLQAA